MAFSAQGEPLQQLSLGYAEAISTLAQAIAAHNDAELILQVTSRTIGQVLKVDRAVIYDVCFERELIIGLNEWLNPDQPSITSSIDTFPLDVFRGGASWVKQHQCHLVSSQQQAHPSLKEDGSAEILHQQMQIQTLMWFPFAFREQAFHLLALNQVYHSRQWTADEIAFLDSVSQLVTLALNKIQLLDRHRQELEFLAFYDALTGLPNRTLLTRELSSWLRSRDAETRLVVAYLDLDSFRKINETYGHPVGDHLLQQLANRLRSSLPREALLARPGGDEFIVVFACQLEESLDQLLEQLLVTISTPLKIDALSLQMYASLGCTVYPQQPDQTSIDAEQLLRQADQAMCSAKLTEKNSWQIFDADQQQRQQQLNAKLVEIRRGLEQQEFVLYYQPKVNMASGEVFGVEALIRWRHPQHGLLLPADFLPYIEAHPLIQDIGDWVLMAACEQLQQWQQDGLKLTVSVNVNAYQLQQANFMERLQQILNGFPALDQTALELEILETSVLDDLPHIIRIIDACHQLGIHISLDDFGTGYSSLAYLKRLPVDALKIDQAFVSHMQHDPDNLSILDGVISLAAAFRRKVIAEGVENREQGLLLLWLGCELAQGFAIAHPMPSEQLPDWIDQWRPEPQWLQQTALPRHELPILYASIEQYSWLLHLQRYLAGEAETPPELNEQHCRFGQWLTACIETSGLPRTTLEHITRLHRMLHHLADDLCAGHSESTVLHLQLQNAHQELQQLLQQSLIHRHSTLG